MLFKDTLYTQTGIFKRHTNGTCGEGEIRINMKYSMDMLFVSPLSLGVRCSLQSYPWYIAVLVGKTASHKKNYHGRVVGRDP
jgi:hypothetical protein